MLKIMKQKALKGPFSKIKAFLNSDLGIGLESLDSKELENDIVIITVVNMNAIPWSEIRDKAKEFGIELISVRNVEQ